MPSLEQCFDWNKALHCVIIAGSRPVCTRTPISICRSKRLLKQKWSQGLLGCRVRSTAKVTRWTSTCKPQTLGAVPSVSPANHGQSGRSSFRTIRGAGLSEFATCIGNNRAFIPNFRERWRQGEAISTGFVESTINYVVRRRFVKKQQMQWTLRGTHLLLQDEASQRGTGGHVPPMVPQIHAATTNAELRVQGGLTPQLPDALQHPCLRKAQTKTFVRRAFEEFC
jgi:hypothetical protein